MRIRLAGTIFTLALAAACAPSPEGGPLSGASRPSIVLISLDTLRPDHLSGYGAPRGTSPTLDTIAAGGAVFTTARCQSSGTLTSHLSLLTSLYPGHFRITRSDGENDTMFSTSLRLPDGVVTLAEALRAHGYDTAAFTGGGFVGARYGFDQGFEVFDENRSRFEGLWLTLPRLRTYLESRADSEAPLFLFVHTYDIHEPYRVPGPIGKRYSYGTFDELALSVGYRPVPSVLNERLDELHPAIAREVEDQYDNGIRFADLLVYRLLRTLEGFGLGKDAIVVVLSDHGEEFLEHGRFNHGPTVYEELARVPLILSGPGVPARQVVPVPVALIDVAPTLLELAGAPAEPQFAGRSLTGLLGGADPPQPAAPGTPPPATAADFRARPVLLDVPDRNAGVRGVVRDGWKLILRSAAAPPELYDLVADPRERRNLAPDTADMAARHEEMRRLQQAVEAEGRNRGWNAVLQPEPANADSLDEVREQLEALGYVE